MKIPEWILKAALTVFIGMQFWIISTLSSVEKDVAVITEKIEHIQPIQLAEK